MANNISKPSKKAPTKKASAKGVEKRTVKQSSSGASIAPTANDWGSIHFLADGNVQMIGASGFNKKISTSHLSSKGVFLSYIASLQNIKTISSFDGFSAIHVLKGAFIDIRPKSDKIKRQRIEWAEIDTKVIKKVVDELVKKLPKD